MGEWKPRAKRVGGGDVSHMQVGKEHMEAGRLNDALAEFEQELLENPGSASAFHSEAWMVRHPRTGASSTACGRITP